MDRPERRRRIGIIGSGALGSYFGIRLAEAGERVGFLLRSDFETVKKEGFELTLANGGRVFLADPEIYPEAKAMGKLDWVLVALKTTRNHLFEELLPPVVGPETILVTVQNGIGNVEALKALFPANPVLAGLCQIGVNRERPGRIRSFVPGDGFVQIGAPAEGRDGDSLDPLEEMLTSAGIRVRRARSLGEALWRKLMWNVPFNGLTVAIGGKGTDAVCGDERLRAEAKSLMEEIRVAANALGYSIEPEYTDKLMGFTDNIGAYKASSVLDWLSGRPLEVEAIFQKPLEAGRSAGVEMPHMESLTAILGGLSPP